MWDLEEASVQEQFARVHAAARNEIMDLDASRPHYVAATLKTSAEFKNSKR